MITAKHTIEPKKKNIETNYLQQHELYITHTNTHAQANIYTNSMQFLIKLNHIFNIQSRFAWNKKFRKVEREGNTNMNNNNNNNLQA